MIAVIVILYVLGYLSVSFYDNVIEQISGYKLKPKVPEFSLFCLWWIVPIVAFLTVVNKK